MHCLKCGHEIADDANFCSFCGAANSIALQYENSEKNVEKRYSNRKRKGSGILKIAIWLLIGILAVYVFVSQ